MNCIIEYKKCNKTESRKIGEREAGEMIQQSRMLTPYAKNSLTEEFSSCYPCQAHCSHDLPLQFQGLHTLFWTLWGKALMSTDTNMSTQKLKIKEESENNNCYYHPKCLFNSPSFIDVMFYFVRIL